MQTRIDTTFSGKNLSTAVSVYEYTVPEDGMYSFQVRLAAVDGNGDYVFFLTLNDGDAQTDDPMFPKTTVPLASGDTKGWFPTLKVAALSGDVINVFVLGQGGDTNEAGSIRIFSENYAVAGDEMDLVDAPNATALIAVGTAVWATTVRSLSTFGTLVADIWAYAKRILTNTAASTGSVADGANLTLTNKVSFAATLTGLTIPATWEKFYLTVKVKPKDDDEDAILQILVTEGGDSGDGIQYVNKAAASTTEKAYGSLTVGQGAGTLAIVVADDMEFDHAGKYKYDLKYFYPDNDSAKPAGSAKWTIKDTETHAHNEGA